MNTEKDCWIKPYELAKKLGVKNQTIYRWIREGRIPENQYRKVEIVVKRIELRKDIKKPKR